MKSFPFVLLRAPANSLNHIDRTDLWSSGSFKEGLYVASRALFKEYERVDSLDVKKQKKVNQSILKYWIRSCMRSTPYGVFAGSGLLNVSSAPTSIILDGNESHKRLSRLDMDCLMHLVELFQQNPIVKMQLKLFPNESIYEVNDQLRYVEFDIQKDLRDYRLTSVSSSTYIKEILDFCKNGCTIKDLALHLAEKEDVEYEDAEDFIIEMWNSQVLSSDLDPPVTGSDPLTFLINKLSSFNGITGELNSLIKIQELLLNLKSSVANYQDVETEISLLCGDSEDFKDSIQTDLFLNTSANNIEQRLVDTIIDQCEDLFALTRKFDIADLNSFKNRFVKKFGNESIPLTIVMDSDLGIGYSHDTEQKSTDEQGGYEKHDSFDFIQRYTLTKFYEYLKDGKEYIELSETELKKLKLNSKGFKFPNSMYILGNLIGKNGKIDADNFSFSLGLIGGPSAGSLLGRFTNGDDVLLDLTKKTLIEEEKEYPDSIYAEIVHLPQARIGNILQRPVLRDYEIPFICQSGVNKDKQISIQDLFVCIENDEIILWSKRLAKRIIPRLTTAHNFVINSLPLYKFLCDLQIQDKSFVNVWDWGNLSILKHLPRVVYKNLIVRKAEWKVSNKDLSTKPLNDDDLIKEVKRFREVNGIPALVTINEGDNDLLINLESRPGIDLFLSFLDKSDHIVIKEFVFNDHNCVIKDLNNNSYANELLIPFNRPVEPVFDHMTRTPSTYSDSTADSKFLIGSEWLYFKVYGNYQQLDELLAGPVQNFINSCLQTQHFERFFFIRYQDTGTHLRIRMFNNDINKQNLLQNAFMEYFKPLFLTGLIDNIVMDTYCREVERYIPGLNEAAEMIFHNDSIFCLSVLNELSEEMRQKLFLTAMDSINTLLDDFEFPLADKYLLLSKMQAAFFIEFNGDSTMQKDLNNQFREHRVEINSFMDQKYDSSIQYGDALVRRSSMNKEAIEFINTYVQENGVDKRELLYKLLPSYIHMLVNRLMSKDQRRHELLIYHLLERYYHSKQLSSNPKLKYEQQFN